MHDEALTWLKQIAALVGQHSRVCELGSRDVNGNCRDLFGGFGASVGVDLLPGPGVDVVADAADWQPAERGPRFGVVIATEVFEHSPRAAEICANAHRLLRPGGVFVVTAAGVGRSPHSVDGGPLRDGEYYRGVSPEMLWGWLDLFPVRLVQPRSRADVYGLAVK